MNLAKEVDYRSGKFTVGESINGTSDIVERMEVFIHEYPDHSDCFVDIFSKKDNALIKIATLNNVPVLIYWL